jgi:hypothetical protein
LKSKVGLVATDRLLSIAETGKLNQHIPRATTTGRTGEAEVPVTTKDSSPGGVMLCTEISGSSRCMHCVKGFARVGGLSVSDKLFTSFGLGLGDATPPSGNDTWANT